MNVKHKVLATATGLMLLSAAVAPAAAASIETAHFAAFKNCTDLTKTYPHGVMKKHYTRTYWYNHGATAPAYRPRIYAAVASSMDRDHDGIACER
jgi:hypothetical protein